MGCIHLLESTLMFSVQRYRTVQIGLVSDEIGCGKSMEVFSQVLMSETIKCGFLPGTLLAI